LKIFILENSLAQLKFGRALTFPDGLKQEKKNVLSRPLRRRNQRNPTGQT